MRMHDGKIKDWLRFLPGGRSRVERLFTDAERGIFRACFAG
ncbi:hypothetical protein VQ044_22140 [Aurantimonas sp. C2-5-R2]